MSLAAYDLNNLAYDDEKGESSVSLSDWMLTNPTELIRGFLSKFKTNEKDLATDFANFDIQDHDDPQASETRSLKYMSQLVRVDLPV